MVKIINLNVYFTTIKKNGGKKSKDAMGILGHMFLEAAHCRGHRQSKMGEK